MSEEELKKVSKCLNEEELKKVSGGEEDRPYKCPHCGVSYAERSKLSIHIMQEHKRTY